MGYRSYGRESSDLGSFGVVGLVILGIIWLFVSYGLGMSSLSEDVTLRAAEGSGLTNVEMGPAQSNFLYFQCGNGDTAHRDVIGVNPQGTRVSIVVCGGWLKGATVRYP